MPFENSHEATLKPGLAAMLPEKLWTLPKHASWSSCDLGTTSKFGHFMGQQAAWWGSIPHSRAALWGRHKRFHSSRSTHQSVCIHEDTFAIMSKSPTMKLSEGYTQLWPLHQSQMDWVSTIKHIHLDYFVKYAVEDRPTRASSGEKEGNLERFRVDFWHENSDIQHHINYNNRLIG